MLALDRYQARDLRRLIGPFEVDPLGRPRHARPSRRVFTVVLVALVMTAGLLATQVGDAQLGQASTGASPAYVSTTVAVAPPVPSIRTADLANATYPTAACAAYCLPGDTFTLVDGRAGSPPDLTTLPQPWPTDTRGVELGAVAYGDLTGDGAEDAAVVLTCYLANSDALTRGVAVVTMTPTGPATIAMLPRSQVPALGVFVVHDEHGTPIGLEERELQYDLAEQIQITDGLLVVHWFQTSLGGDALGDGYDVTARYRIGPEGAVLAGPPDRHVVPSTAG
jgi:hypothetical protein